MSKTLNSRAPQWLQGVWRRAGRAIDGQPPEEVSDVVWAQVGTYFADVRVPVPASGDGSAGLCYLDGPQAFSGSLVHNGDTVTWRHDLDTEGHRNGFNDSAVLERKGSTVIERGAGYLEFWKRAGRGPASVLERSDRTGIPTARILTVADLTVAVWSGRRAGGATLRFDDGGWEVEAYVGTGVIPWQAITDIRSGRVPPRWCRVA